MAGPGTRTAFQHLTTDKAPLYRAVLSAFAEAKRHFQVHLRPDDVREVMLRQEREAPDFDALQAALDQLVAWGNLAADPDVSRVTTVEDFYRARFLYQLTREGEAVEAALETYEQTLGRRAALQSVALEDIRTRLKALDALAGEASPDTARAHALLRDLVGVFADLSDNARAFMTGLTRSLAVRRAERQAFLAYKERLIDYLQRFIGDLTTASADIAALLEGLEASGRMPELLRRIAEREAADYMAAEPDSDGGEGDGQEDAIEAQLAGEWQERWHGVVAWFLGSRDHPSQAELLRIRARRAIPEVLDTARRLNEQRLGRSDRSNDFRVLARWFAECPDDASAHRLWRSAFGLTPARHLGIDAQTLAERDTRPVPAATSWTEAPALALSPRLRATGQYRKRGQPPKLVRRDDERALLAQRLHEQAEQTRAARARLLAAGATRLSELDVLERPAFDLFLQLLGEALAAGGGSRRTQTVSGDGSLLVELEPLEADAEAAVETPDGVFRGRDHWIRIVEATPEPLSDGATASG